MRAGKRWGSETATDDPAVLAARLPAELRDPDRWWTDNGLYDMGADVREWLTARKADPDLAMEVLAAAGFDTAEWFKWWLSQPWGV